MLKVYFISVVVAMILGFQQPLLVPGCLGRRFRCLHVWILTVLIVRHSSAFSTILSKPINTVSIAGNKAVMECSKNLLHLPVDWKFAPSGSGAVSYILSDGRIARNMTSKYRIDTDDETRYNIVIHAVDLSDAGTYRCTVGSKSASAELTVLASDPVWNADVKALKGETVEGDYVLMWCDITYNGNMHPVTEQNRSMGKNDSETSGISGTRTSTTVSPSITMQLTSSDNGVTITWKTSFKPPPFRTTLKPGEAVATNVPHYQHLWNFRANVLYSVRNLTIEPNSDIYVIGQRLKCSADGNPRPTFKWTETGTNRVIDSPILAIDSTMALLKKLTFKCTASNILADERKEISDVATFIVIEASSLWNATTIAITVVGVTALTVLLTLCLVKVLRMKACAKETSLYRNYSRETSYRDYYYEMMDESKIQSGNVEHLPQDQSTLNYDDTIHQSKSSSHYAEPVDQCQVQSGNYEHLPRNEIASHYDDTIHQSEGDVVREGYASLNHGSSPTFDQSTVYAQQPVYLDLHSNDV